MEFENRIPGPDNVIAQDVGITELATDVRAEVRKKFAVNQADPGISGIIFQPDSRTTQFTETSRPESAAAD